MFLKEIHDGENYISTRLNFNDNEELSIMGDNDFVVVKQDVEVQDEEFENRSGSISLFSD